MKTLYVLIYKVAFSDEPDWLFIVEDSKKYISTDEEKELAVKKAQEYHDLEIKVEDIEYVYLERVEEAEGYKIKVEES